MILNKTILTILSFFFSVLLVSNSFGQDCIPEEIVLESQEEIDNFANVYPGCTEIIGDLTIGHSSSITNLLGLSHIKSIGGNLEIRYSNQLQSLIGLGSLDSIGGNFVLFQNALTSFVGLESLHTIGGELEIRSNEELSNVNGFPNLLAINSDLLITFNPKLQTIGGLNNLQVIKGNATISYSEKLKDLKGFNSLNTIEGDFTIEENYSLKDLEGLNALEKVGKSFSISKNSNLEDLTGLDSINFIGQSLVVFRNNQLMSLRGIKSSRIQGVDLIHIRSNHALRSLDGIEHIDLTFISNVVIERNSILLKCAVRNVCDHIANCFTITLSENDGNVCNILGSLKLVCKQNFEEFKIKCKIDIFPNPTNNSINVRITGDNLEGIKYEIFDMTGRLVLSGLRHSELIDITNLLAGAYLLRINNDEQVEVFRFVKN